MTSFFENEKNISEKLKKGKILRFIYVTVKYDNCKSGRNVGDKNERSIWDNQKTWRNIKI